MQNSTQQDTWTFRVEGRLAQDDHAVEACEIIVESGDRAQESPFRLLGVGPLARSGADGPFRSRFEVAGDGGRIRAPGTVTVFLRVAPGRWAPVVVAVMAGCAMVLGARAMRLALGEVRISGEVEPRV